MVFIFEIDKRFHWKPWRSFNHLRFGWLWFAFAIWEKPYEKMVMEAHDWTMPDGKRYTSYEQLIERDGE